MLGLGLGGRGWMCACQRVRMRAQILSGGQVAPGERPWVGVTSPVEIRAGPARCGPPQPVAVCLQLLCFRALL